MKTKSALKQRNIEKYLNEIVALDFHAKRVLSLSNAVVGVIHAVSLSVHAIGMGLAKSGGIAAKHAIKQVDRLFSNTGIVMDAFFRRWVPYVVGAQTHLVVAMDWTEFDADDHATIALSTMMSYGRALPLIWKTVKKSDLKGQRNGYEDEVLALLKAALPAGVRVTILADRGFGDHKLYEYLKEVLGFEYVIRFKGDIMVSTAEGEVQAARDYLAENGRAKILRYAKVTAAGYEVGAVVCVHDKRMKDAWFLATSLWQLSATEVTKLYGKRFTIEETFRDTKDSHFGLGLSEVRIGSEVRRDRILLVCAIAITLLTTLGMAGESLGMDRLLKANTSPKRQHSFFRQGFEYYGFIPTMDDIKLAALMNRFSEIMLSEHLYNYIFNYA